MSALDRLTRGASKLLAFIRRDFLEASSYKLNFAYTLGGIVFSSATFYFVGRLVPGGAASLAPYGGDYFSFAVVGVAFSGLLGIFQEGPAGMIRSAQVSGTLEALLITQTSVPTILVGSTLYSFLFAAVRTIVHLAVALVLFGLKLGTVNVPAVLAVLVMTSVCYLSIGILSASFVLIFKVGNPVGWVFSSVSGFLGGMIFPVSVLPAWIRWISPFLPFTHSLEGLRRSLLASASFGEVLPSIAALGAFSAVLLPAGLVLFRVALRKAKRDGSLTQF
jgi:ABC-2 type transport system permease protein